MACRKDGIQPARQFDLSAVRQIGCAGAPLATEGYVWLVEQMGQGVLLNVGSGVETSVLASPESSKLPSTKLSF